MIGFVISLFQSMTQIQEFTLAFVPKLIGVGLSLLFSGNWMLHTLIDYTNDLFTRIPGLLAVEGRGADRRAWVVSGLKDLVVAKTTGSEFWGFLKDEYTTLQETDRPDHGHLAGRPLALREHRRRTSTSPTRRSRALLLEQFAQVHSYALQQTLYAMGQAVLEELPEVAEIRFKAPNKHHFLVDLSPFGVENPGEVFYAADRPYGLIEAEVGRDDASEPGSAWNTIPGFC